MAKSTEHDFEPAGKTNTSLPKGVLNSVNDAILVANESQYITFINHRAEDLFGYEAQEVYLKPLALLFPALPSAAVSKNKAHLLELEGCHKNGGLISVEAGISQYHSGEETEIILILRDITGKKKAEALLLESEEKFRVVFESANVGKSITLPSGEISVNQAFADMLGHSREELCTKTWQSITPPEDIEAINKILSRIIGGKTDSARFEKRYIKKDGSYVWTDVSVSCRRDTSGRLLYFIATIVDISEQKLTLQKLNESEERFRSIVEGSPDGFFIEMDQKFVFLNPSTCRILGIDSPEQLIGTSVIEIIHPDFRERARERIRRLHEARESVKELFEVRFLRADGSEIWVETSGEPIQIDGKNGALVVVRDITKRKEMEKAREESEARFRLLAESTPIGIVISDRKNQIIYVSPGFIDIFGYTLDDVPTVPAWYQLAYPDPQYRAGVKQQWREAIQKAADTGAKIEPHVFAVCRKDGAIRQVEFRMQSTEGLNFVVMTDVTARVVAEAETTRQKEILQLFIEHSPAAIAMFDRDMRYIAVSRRFLLDYDISDRDVVGKTHYDVFPELSQGIKEIHQRSLAGEIISSEEDAFPRANGRTDWVRWEVRPWYETGGMVGGIILFSEVITSRKQAELALQRYNKRLENLHTIDQATLQGSKEPESVARMAVQALCKMIGCSQAAFGIFDSCGRKIQVSLIENGAADIRQHEIPLDPGLLVKLQSLASGGMEINENNSTSRSSKQLAAILKKPPAPSSLRIPMKIEKELIGFIYLGWGGEHHFSTEEVEIAGEVSQQIAIAIHQSHLRKALAAHAAELEDRVNERTAQLEASNKDLEAFAYSVSHDLRAPLRNILSFSQILEEDYGEHLDDEGRRVLGIIQNSTRKMDQLITDLLALSRASRVKMEYSSVDMTSLARSVYEEIAGPEVRKKIGFSLAELPDCPADPTLIRQVWTNLISNAIKYTGPKTDGRIEISGARADGECVYSVCDNGVGFDETYKNNLFRLFQRLHKESEFEGTGVGLAIVQRIIQRHGGRVWAEGRPGEGAIFHFSLPEQRGNGTA